MLWKIFLCLSLVSCTWKTPPATFATGPQAQLHPDHSVPPPPIFPLRQLTRGEALYIRYCADCHGWQGKGQGPATPLLGTTPPSLRRAELYDQNTEADLVARILIGKDLTVPLTPEASLANEADTQAIMAHLKRLPTLKWEQLDHGRDVYDSLCVSCHGIYGRGDGSQSAALPAPPRDLSTPPYQHYVTDTELTRIIAEGKGAMPGAREVLDANDVQAVVAFVRLLSPGYEFYDRLCAVCHGLDGQPSGFSPQDIFGYRFSLKGIPTFDAEYFATHTDEQIQPWIQHMLKSNAAIMPHFSGALDSAEVRQILVYLRSLPAETQTTQ